MVQFNIGCELVFPREEFWRIRSTPTFMRFIVEDGLLKKMEAGTIQEEGDGWLTRTQIYIPGKMECSSLVRALIGDAFFEVHDKQRWCPHRPYRLQFKTHPTILPAFVKTEGTLELDEVADASSLISAGSGSEDGSGTEASEGSDLLHTDGDSRAGSEEEGQKTEDDEQDQQEELDSDNQGKSDRIRKEKEEQDSFDLSYFQKSIPLRERCSHVVSGDARVALVTVGWFVERAIVYNLKMFYRDYPKTVAKFRQKLVEDYADGDHSVPISEVVDRFLADEIERVVQGENDQACQEGQTLFSGNPPDFSKLLDAKDGSSDIDSIVDALEELDDVMLLEA